MSFLTAQTLAKQTIFVEWLKSRGMYSPFDSAQTMQKAFQVWEILYKEDDDEQQNM